MDRFLEQFQNPQAVEDDGHVVEGLFNFYFLWTRRLGPMPGFREYRWDFG